MPRKKRQRRTFTDEQKFKMVIEVIKGEKPLSTMLADMKSTPPVTQL